MAYPGFKSLHQLAKVKQLDIVVLKQHLYDFNGLDSADKNGQWFAAVKCPFCRGRSEKTKKEYVTASVYEHRGGEGLSFHCHKCGVTQTSVYHLLRHLEKPEVAERYAQARHEQWGAVGTQWSCPFPEKEKQRRKENRRCEREAKAARMASTAKKPPHSS
jgi:hypothetical protein